MMLTASSYQACRWYRRLAGSISYQACGTEGWLILFLTEPVGTEGWLDLYLIKPVVEKAAESISYQVCGKEGWLDLYLTEPVVQKAGWINILPSLWH